LSKTIRIGGASGFWGESDSGFPQLLDDGSLHYIVFDYLAEITMSIMARARAKDRSKGYATDFVTAAIKPHLNKIQSSGVKLISNAGGVNPEACGKAVEALIKEAGLDLTVAVVTGDDLTARAAEFSGATEMFTGEAFPDPAKIASINAYLGAFPIASALGAGADIVITGRCVDSAVTLGACIHEFGWARTDLNELAGGSLAGHIIECGPQATGGNFTDWRDVVDGLIDIGYPIAEVSGDGSFTVSKPDGTGGAVTVGTVGEQMLYEIGDPQAYMLPDVVCDFSAVEIEQVGDNLVRVSGATGRPAPDTYKASVTWQDGWRIGALFFFVGEDASEKARHYAEVALERARRKLRGMNAPDYTETLIEIVGDESHYGAATKVTGSREVTFKLAAKHPDPKGAALLLKEATGLALATPAGLTLFSGGRAKPSPVVRLFSMAVPKAEVPYSVSIMGGEMGPEPETGTPFDASTITRPAPPEVLSEMGEMTEVPLIRLAVARSGDKGNKANIGVLPRKPEYAPYIWNALDEGEVTRRFAHFLAGKVERFYMPGTGAMNILMHNVLGGGGVASLRNDPQGKTYAQILLQTPVSIPVSMAESL